MNDVRITRQNDFSTDARRKNSIERLNRQLCHLVRQPETDQTTNALHSSPHERSAKTIHSRITEVLSIQHCCQLPITQDTRFVHIEAWTVEAHDAGNATSQNIFERSYCSSIANCNRQTAIAALDKANSQVLLIKRKYFSHTLLLLLSDGVKLNRVVKGRSTQLTLEVVEDNTRAIDCVPSQSQQTLQPNLAVTWVIDCARKIQIVGRCVCDSGIDDNRLRSSGTWRPSSG